ncbi:hypothetical protein FAZ15_14945 [Sphingobacterium olei]|uniref:DUF5018 domain-containing protein n=1 Tax=Sphingobacterium olei TaxID=2571155 RepID=A0A4U0NWZ9_9SPHI|nr:hypothetical protein [Sphingobacterium olei]TJZ54774.1 hypothetical protein FAZ15_14945 [Sphingobacterium olei]
MKTRFHIFSIPLYLIVLLISCKKTADDIAVKPDLSVDIVLHQAIPVSVTSKDKIEFDVTVTSSSSAVLKTGILSLNGEELQREEATSASEITIKHSYQALDTDVGKSLIFHLRVDDEDGNTAKKDFTIYVQSAPAAITFTLPEDRPEEILDNETATFNIAVASELDLKYIKTSLDGTEITALTQESFADPKLADYRFDYTPTASDIGKTLTFQVEVMDVLGNVVRQEFQLRIVRSNTVDFKNFFDINLGAQRSTAAGPFLNAHTGEVHVPSGVSQQAAQIDLVTFYSGSTFSYNITSPTLASVADNIYTVALFGADAMANWSVRNSTLIKKIDLSRTEFDAIESGAAIESLYSSSSVAPSATSGAMANNAAIVFMTAQGKYGVLYVKSRTANNNTGVLTVDLKIQD